MTRFCTIPFLIYSLPYITFYFWICTFKLASCICVGVQNRDVHLLWVVKNIRAIRLGVIRLKERGNSVALLWRCCGTPLCSRPPQWVMTEEASLIVGTL